jgi:hypothetical protein
VPRGVLDGLFLAFQDVLVFDLVLASLGDHDSCVRSAYCLSGTS